MSVRLPAAPVLDPGQWHSLPADHQMRAHWRFRPRHQSTEQFLSNSMHSQFFFQINVTQNNYKHLEPDPIQQNFPSTQSNPLNFLSNQSNFTFTNLTQPNPTQLNFTNITKLNLTFHRPNPTQLK